MDKNEKAEFLAKANASVPTILAKMALEAETNHKMDITMRRFILKVYGKRSDAEIDAIFAACPSVRRRK